MLAFDFLRITWTAFGLNPSLMLLQAVILASNSFSRSFMFFSSSGLIDSVGSQALNMTSASILLVTIILTKAGSFKNLKIKYI